MISYDMKFPKTFDNTKFATVLSLGTIISIVIFVSMLSTAKDGDAKDGLLLGFVAFSPLLAIVLFIVVMFMSKAEQEKFKEDIAQVIRDEIQEGMKGVNAKHDGTNAKPDDTEARPSRVEEHPNDPGATQDSGKPPGNRDDHQQDGARGSGQ